MRLRRRARGSPLPPGWWAARCSPPRPPARLPLLLRFASSRWGSGSPPPICTLQPAPLLLGSLLACRWVPAACGFARRRRMLLLLRPPLRDLALRLVSNPSWSGSPPRGCVLTTVLMLRGPLLECRRVPAVWGLARGLMMLLLLRPPRRGLGPIRGSSGTLLCLWGEGIRHLPRTLEDGLRCGGVRDVQMLPEVAELCRRSSVRWLVRLSVPPTSNGWTDDVSVVSAASISPRIARSR
jgi:hypothetical protein